MRILYYAPQITMSRSRNSGSGTHIRGMINAFKEQGHEVYPVIMGERSAAAGGDPGTGPHSIKKSLKSILPGPILELRNDLLRLRRDAEQQRALKRAIDDFKPDVIYERASYLQTSGVNAAAARSITHILEVNAPLVEERQALAQTWSPLLWLGNRLEFRQLRATSRIVVVSSALKRYFNDRHDLSGCDWVITPNAVDPAVVAAAEDSGARIRADLGLGDSRVIGFVGSMYEWHGVDILIRAFGELAAAYADARLLIVGDGRMLSAWRALADQLEMNDRIIFTGDVPHDQVYHYIDTMDIAVMPRSNWYGSPVKIFEYGALGKPIVAPDTGPVREVMVDGSDGLLVQPHEGELVRSLTMLLDNPELRRSMGERFQSKVYAKHTWQKNVAAVLSGL